MTNNNKGDYNDLFEYSDDDSREELPKITLMENVRDNFTDRQRFCAKIATAPNPDKDLLSFVIDTFGFSKDAKLGKQFNSCRKNLDEYWEEIEYYIDHLDEAKRIIGTAVRDKKTNYFKACKKALHIEGASTLVVGNNPIEFAQTYDQNGAVKVALQDMSLVIDGAYADKQSDLENTYKNLTESMPYQISAELKSTSSKKRYIDTMLDRFDEGNLDIQLDPSNFKHPKECGVMLPHTLDPQAWVATTVTTLIQQQYGKEVLVTFQGDVQFARRYNSLPGDYIVCSDNEDSPHHINTSPALYDNSVVDEVWNWRSVQAEANKFVALEAAKSIGMSHAERESIRGTFLKEQASIIAHGSGISIRYSGQHPYFGKISGNLEQRYAVRCFKRGYSSVGEVEEHHQYIHVVSSNAARDVHSSYFQIKLPDFNSVLLIPKDFWQKSAWMNAEWSRDKVFSTQYGVENFLGNDDAIKMFLVLMCLSLTRTMFKQWTNKLAFDYKEESRKLLKLALTKDSYPGLFTGSLVKNAKTRKKFLFPITRMMPGVLVGLLIEPASSKIGKQSMAGLRDYSNFEAYVSKIGTQVDSENGDKRDMNTWVSTNLASLDDFDDYDDYGFEPSSEDYLDHESSLDESSRNSEGVETNSPDKVGSGFDGDDDDDSEDDVDDDDNYSIGAVMSDLYE